jgi:restriction endonuclease Mrr
LLSERYFSQMTLLDDLSGYEFEEKMVRVFEKVGYRNVRQLPRAGDKGRDIVMEESDGTAVVVECKHTATVGRPVVQKLHSAASTYDHDDEKKGMVVTTGRFTSPAREYAEKVGVELIDGRDLRDIGEEIGMDMYNGRIEILCDRTFEVNNPEPTVRKAFRDIENFPLTEAEKPDAALTLHPVLSVETRTDAVFETGVGVIHRVHDSETFYLKAGLQGGNALPEDVERMVADDLRARKTVGVSDDLEKQFGEVNLQRFEGTEEDYVGRILKRCREKHATTVRYTGDNNVTYTKDCVPDESDVDIVDMTPVYLPRVRANVEVMEYDHPYEWYETTSGKEVSEDSVHRCVQCGGSDGDTYTFCENCGSINCPSHTKTERVEGEPVCTGCAVTERFALKKKYFYDEENLEEFRTEYAEMPAHEKAMENKPLVGVATVAAIVLVLFAVQSLIGA